jgi:hypothetical protein
MQELLEFAGTLNMSEGNYLKVANALRDVFPKLDEQAPTLQWEQTLPVGDFRMILSDFIYSTGLVRIVYDFTTCKLIKKTNKGGNARYDHGINCNIVYEYVDKQIERKKTLWNSMQENAPVAKPKTIQVIMDGVEYTHTIQQFCKDEIEFHHQVHLMNGDSEEEWNDETGRQEAFGYPKHEGTLFFNTLINNMETHIHNYCTHVRFAKDNGLD